MTRSRAIADEALNQVRNFHSFLQAWLSGSMNGGDSAIAEALENFDRGFICIDPLGHRQNRDQLSHWLKAAHGSEPGLRICVTGEETLWCTEDAALISYEEHQFGPRANTRRAVAFFRGERGHARWLHLSEAWIA